MFLIIMVFAGVLPCGVCEETARRPQTVQDVCEGDSYSGSWCGSIGFYCGVGHRVHLSMDRAVLLASGSNIRQDPHSHYCLSIGAPTDCMVIFHVRLPYSLDPLSSRSLLLFQALDRWNHFYHHLWYDKLVLCERYGAAHSGGHSSCLLD